MADDKYDDTYAPAQFVGNFALVMLVIAIAAPVILAVLVMLGDGR